MTIISCKLCLIILALAIFFGNTVCDQLKNEGTFDMEGTKTQAFMNAFYYLRILHDYQNELWNKFIEVMQKRFMNYVGPLIENYVQYTSARSPWDFCNGIESPPEKIIFINKHGQLEEMENPKYKQSSQSVHRVTQFQADPNYQLVSSSGGGKSIRDFDLNEIPPNEDE